MKFKLKDLCIENNISCLQLEKKLNIHNARLSKYCKQEFYPNIERLIILANYFECSIDFMVGLSPIKLNKKLSNANIEKFFLRLNNLISNEKSKTAFFKKCGLARTNLTRWEQKKQFPRLENIYLIAKYTNTSLDYLLGRTDIREII